jgi:hypothetical protein
MNGSDAGVRAPTPVLSMEPPMTAYDDTRGDAQSSTDEERYLSPLRHRAQLIQNPTRETGLSRGFSFLQRGQSTGAIGSGSSTSTSAPWTAASCLSASSLENTDVPGGNFASVLPSVVLLNVRLIHSTRVQIGITRLPEIPEVTGFEIPARSLRIFRYIYYVGSSGVLSVEHCGASSSFRGGWAANYQSR